MVLSPCAGTEEEIRNMGYQRLDFPLKHVTVYRSFGIFYTFGKLIRLLDRKYRGSAKPSEIDAIIDISGFAYSDQWGDKAVHNMNLVIKMFKKFGTKFIFLPQAFGPFSSDGIRQNMIKLLHSADLVFARDIDSEKMLRALWDDQKIIRSPDITIGLKPLKNRQMDGFEEYVCVVPNERMLDQGREFWPEGKYLAYVKQIIKAMVNQTTYKIYLVVHDNGKGDVVLADMLASEFANEKRVEKFFEYEPLKMKTFLGGSQIVFGSRFHALVSALSQNIPCLSLGWSHKYKMLFEEYGIEEYSFDTPNDQYFEEKLKDIIDINTRAQITRTIAQNNVVLKEKNNKMWEKTNALLNH